MPSQNGVYLKLISLLSLVRGQNLAVLVIAQLLSSAFIFSTQASPRVTFLDVNLWLIVLATVLSVAAGYIINAFFDQEKDLINRPQKTLLEQNISERSKLIGYFTFNGVALLVSCSVSQKSALFFCAYIVSMALYSGFLKRYLFVGNLVSAALTVLPFFAITVYFKNFTMEIFTLASYLLLLISIKELVKDLCNIRGDLSNNYKTIPTVYGEVQVKGLISLLVCFCFGVFFLLYFFFSLQGMLYYFIASLVFLVFFTILLWRFSKTNQLIFLLFGIKALILLGIICLPLLKIPI
ncbi:MAG: geranylgeranylglycerol-phosphate geranylgeranyltransferase [Flavobacteriaceae bacterium]